MNFAGLYLFVYFPLCLTVSAPFANTYGYFSRALKQLSPKHGKRISPLNSLITTAWNCPKTRKKNLLRITIGLLLSGHLSRSFSKDLNYLSVKVLFLSDISNESSVKCTTLTLSLDCYLVATIFNYRSTLYASINFLVLNWKHNNLTVNARL